MNWRNGGTFGETDPVVLARRQRQIDFGKNSVSYFNYMEHIPKEKRCPSCPKTPDKYRKCSRRGFDSLIRKWKIGIHEWSDAIDIVEGRKDARLMLTSTESEKRESPPMPISRFYSLFPSSKAIIAYQEPHKQFNHYNRSLPL